MRWKYGVLTIAVTSNKFGFDERFPIGTEVLVGGEDWLGNQMVWQVSIGEYKLHLEKEHVLICTKEELRIAKMIYGP